MLNIMFCFIRFVVMGSRLVLLVYLMSVQLYIVHPELRDI